MKPLAVGIAALTIALFCVIGVAAVIQHYEAPEGAIAQCEEDIDAYPTDNPVRAMRDCLTERVNDGVTR